jgi:hypothetical protein
MTTHVFIDPTMTWLSGLCSYHGRSTTCGLYQSAFFPLVYCVVERCLLQNLFVPHIPVSVVWPVIYLEGIAYTAHHGAWSDFVARVCSPGIMSDATEPTLARSRKRKALDHDADTERIHTFTVKAAFSTVFKPGPSREAIKGTEPILFPFLTINIHLFWLWFDSVSGCMLVCSTTAGVLTYCSELRKLVSVVAKQHWFTLIQEIVDDPSAMSKLFTPNHNYFSRVKTVITGTLSRPVPVYTADLQAAWDAIKLHIPKPVYTPPPGDPRFTVSAIGQIMGFHLKQLAENLSTHVDEHVFDCITKWAKNLLRARLPDEEYDGGVKRAINKRFNAMIKLRAGAASPDRDLKDRYDVYVQQ